jgi:hypothetical protein
MRRSVGRVHRKDANHDAIVTGLRQLGATVCLIGPLDILAGWRGYNVLLEVKTATGQVRESQRDFLAIWRGQAAVVRSLDEAIRVIQKVVSR